jgi:hypothetical protein
MTDSRLIRSPGLAADAVPATDTAAPASWAPSGFEDVDVEILEWIASHRRGERKQDRTRAKSPGLAA